MLPRRRIFRSASKSSPWGRAAAILLTAALGALLLTARLPSSLLGSTPADVEWRAAATDVRVVDGNTLRLPAGVVRLRGIRAPARGERCADRSGTGLDCGAAAADALAGLVAGQDLTCHVSVQAGSGGAGHCFIRGSDVGATLVRDGWAITARDPAGALTPLQDAARAAHRGLWRNAPAAWPSNH